MSSVLSPQPNRVSALEQRIQQLANQVQQLNTDMAHLAATVDSNQQQLLAILGTLVPPSTAVIVPPAPTPLVTTSIEPTPSYGGTNKMVFKLLSDKIKETTLQFRTWQLSAIRCIIKGRKGLAPFDSWEFL